MLTDNEIISIMNSELMDLRAEVSANHIVTQALINSLGALHGENVKSAFIDVLKNFTPPENSNQSEDVQQKTDLLLEKVRSFC